MKAIIIDDELKVRSVLKNIISTYCPDIELIGEADGVQSSYACILGKKPDVVFLDIEMQDGDGFELINKLGSERNCEIVLVTSYNHYAIKGLKMEVFDYIVKPIVIEELVETVGRLKARFLKKQEITIKDSTLSKAEETLTINSQNKTEVIPLQNILYLKGDGNYTHIYTLNNKSYHVSKTLLQYEHVLCKPDSFFLRIHKTYIANLTYVDHIQKGIKPNAVLKNGTAISLSKDKKDDLIKAIQTLI